MAQTVFNGDWHVNGTATAKTLIVPSSTITNAMVAASAGIDASKVVHQFPLFYQQSPGSAVVAATYLLHIGRFNGTIAAVEAAVNTVATGGDRTVSVDLKKSTGGGAFSSCLASAIQFTNGSAALTPTAGTLSVTTFGDNDILELTVAVAGAAGNQAQGLLVTVTLQESPV